MTKEDDGFLRRWSRRKADAQGGLVRKEPERPRGRMNTDPPLATLGDAGCADTDLKTDQLGDESVVKIEAAVVERSAVDGSLSEAEAGRTDEIASADTPEHFDDVDFESLTYESDFTRFMQANVPEAIRRKALKKLWLSDPILANLDGLNDYDEDFTDAKLAVEILQTSHNVGRGYLTEDEVAENERIGRENAEETASDDVQLAEVQSNEEALLDAKTTEKDKEHVGEDRPEEVSDEPETKQETSRSFAELNDDEIEDGDLDPA